MVTSAAFKSATTTAMFSDRRESAYAEPVGTTENSRTSPYRHVSSRNVWSKKNAGSPKKTAVARAGIEPATHGFSVRCSVKYRLRNSYSLQEREQKREHIPIAKLLRLASQMTESQIADWICAGRDLLGTSSAK